MQYFFLYWFVIVVYCLLQVLVLHLLCLFEQFYFSGQLVVLHLTSQLVLPLDLLFLGQQSALCVFCLPGL